MRAVAPWLGLALALLLSLWADVAQAQTGPLGSESKRTFAGPSVTARSEPPGIWSRFWQRAQEAQQALHRKLAVEVRRIKTEGYSAGWLLVVLSFLYGVMHAVGPGHGKAVISSYLVAEERTIRRGVLLSFLSAGAQAVSAVVLVGVLAIALGAAGMQIKVASDWMERASYALVALLGGWMTLSQVKALAAPRKQAAHADAHGNHAHHGHHHDHGGCKSCSHLPDLKQIEGEVSLRKMAAVVLAVGVRPCTGAVIVLVFALANGLFLAGVGATFAMALGTAITVSVLAALAVGSKQLAVKLARGDDLWADRIYRVAALAGSVLLLLLGAALFIASLGPARPF